MSVEVALSSMVASAVEQALSPLIASLAQFAQVATMLGTPNGTGTGTSAPAAIKRGPGRPKAVEVSQDAPAKRGRGRPKKVDTDSGDLKVCAVIDCGRPARSKGYCAAHYQKFRMLEKTDRLPADWVADAAPNSVENIILPRGRAGAKALAEMR